MSSGSEKVDWSRAPRLARWWAINKDGNAHWYCAPDIACYSSFWFSDAVPAASFRRVGRQQMLQQLPTLVAKTQKPAYSGLSFSDAMLRSQMLSGLCP